MKVVIIGGVAAGMSAASKLKRNRKDQVEIMVYEKGGEVSYGACGIPFYISDHIKQGKDLIARTAEEFSQSGIPIKTYHEVLHVDTDKKTVLVKNLRTGEEFTDTYDKLVVGSGAAVRHFPPFDKEYENLFEIRDVADGTRVKTALFDEKNRHVVIMGAGFIGLEVSEACRRYGKEVTVVELADRILSSFDQEVSRALEEELEKNGVTVKTGCKVVDLKVEDGRIAAAVVEAGDGSREEQVLNIGKVNREGGKAAEAAPTAVGEVGFGHIEPRPRPDVTRGFTEKMKIGCGSLYVTTNYDENGICEVFTSTGKAGGCPSQSEATARLVSVALRSGISINEVYDQLKGIRCPSTIRQQGMSCTSCPDAIAKVIMKVSKLIEEQPKEKAQREEAAKLPPQPVKNPVIPATAGEIHACPECGSVVEHEGGCVICRNCGFSKCG